MCRKLRPGWAGAELRQEVRFYFRMASSPAEVSSFTHALDPATADSDDPHATEHALSAVSVVGDVPPPLPPTGYPWILRLVTVGWAARSGSAGASTTGGARTAGSWARSRASPRRPPSPTSLLIIGARPRSRALPTRCLTQPLTAPRGSPSRPYSPPASLAPERGRLPPRPRL